MMSGRFITVYTPDSSLASPLRMIRMMFRDLAASRSLGWRLAVRELSAQYRQSLFGFLWALIIPLANAVVWIFLSRSGIVKVADTGLPYPVYVFVGTMLWGIFMDALNAPLQITTVAKPMLAKINFTRESLVLAGIYQTLFSAAIKVALMFAALVLMGILPGWVLLLFPFGILSLILVGTVIGLLLTPLGILYSDVGRAIPLLAQFLMYATPVVFPMPKSGWGAVLFQCNPLTPLILTARDWIVGLPNTNLGYFLAVNLATMALLLIVWAMYRLAMPILIERMSA
jgi:lipopolysaccharide transport system permease protein